MPPRLVFPVMPDKLKLIEHYFVKQKADVITMTRKCLLVFVLVGGVFPATAWKQPSAQTIKQPAEVIEAYQVCNRFQEVFVENLDFDHAFEATFTRNVSRRREIAIAEGEFGDLDLARVDTATLVSAYKSRMQILFLMLPLLSAETKVEKARFFPPVIQEILDRKAPKMPEGFNSYAIQLKDDATTFRAHLDRLAKEHPHIAEQIRQFKEETKKLELPTNYVVKPLTAYSQPRPGTGNERRVLPD